jgi:phosphoenolpyruvate synthase/pyruvate phosphate dikinase
MQKLRAAYGHARTLPAEQGEALVLAQMARFREAIAALPFDDGFERDVQQALASLGSIDSTGVFVRSDTNCEDLKDFTGAGLNETVPNRVGKDSVLAAIRKVWASPFTDRAYRWRQRILKNPEHVYPSVILHKTVPSQKSGVMVTADLESGELGPLTISVSEGVAAVVDGGAPETIVVGQDNATRLLASSRSATQKVIPAPPTQGVVVALAAGHVPLLSPAEINELAGLAQEILQKIPPVDGKVPWDIEFGIVDGKAWLLQIRPLRTSKTPAQHPFLLALDAAQTPPPVSINLGAAVP